MKNIIRTVLIILASGWLLPAAVFGQMEWEVDITVSAAHVESRLAIGQRSDATDQRDGRYDVPPMLAGSLKAWLLGSGTSLWRDIRASDASGKEWQLVIDNSAGEPVVVSWSPAALPIGVEMVLTDPDSGAAVDMKTHNSYTLGDAAGGEVFISLTF